MLFQLALFGRKAFGNFTFSGAELFFALLHGRSVFRFDQFVALASRVEQFLVVSSFFFTGVAKDVVGLAAFSAFTIFARRQHPVDRTIKRAVQYPDHQQDERDMDKDRTVGKELDGFFGKRQQKHIVINKKLLK